MKANKRIIAVILSLVLVLGYTCSFSEAGEWICTDCGAANTSNFCTKCGAVKPEEMVCPECGTAYPADSGNLFCGNCGAKLQQTGSFALRYEGEGFDTPEEALTCYMEGLRELNFEKMLSAFAWETQMEHYSIQANLERLGSYVRTMYLRIPSVNDFMFSVNVEILRSYQVELIYHSLEVYILGYDSPIRSNGYISFQKDSDDVVQFLQKYENGKLEQLTKLENIRFLSPDTVTDNLFSNERNMKNFANQQTIYGADDIVNIIGLADIGEELLYCCPTICRYGDKWYLVSVMSMTNTMVHLGLDTQAFICGEGTLERVLSQ